MIQARTTSLATFQRTAAVLRAAPTPTMAPVMVGRGDRDTEVCGQKQRYCATGLGTKPCTSSDTRGSPDACRSRSVRGNGTNEPSHLPLAQGKPAASLRVLKPVRERRQ